MTLREAETRIAELEIALENVLELFQPVDETYEIETLGFDAQTGDPIKGTLMLAMLDSSAADVIESSEEILWGGRADAEEA